MPHKTIVSNLPDVLDAPPSDRCLHAYKRLEHYPSPWKTGRIQKVMLRWANDTCENCGVAGKDGLLHVHHIQWDAKHDCRWENLVVVCVSCHVKIHNHKWQPGRIWSLTAVPQWITRRGLDCGVIEPLASDGKTTDSVSFFDETIVALEKHIRLAQALQKQSVDFLTQLKFAPVDNLATSKLLAQATQSMREGVKIERDSRQEILKLKGHG
jgi:hypothetical protein